MNLDAEEGFDVVLTNKYKSVSTWFAIIDFFEYQGKNQNINFLRSEKQCKLF